jgi:hypothetical protein
VTRLVAGIAWCRPCRHNRMFAGRLLTSATGVQRVRGLCPRCDNRLQGIVGRVMPR